MIREGLGTVTPFTHLGEVLNHGGRELWASLSWEGATPAHHNMYGSDTMRMPEGQPPNDKASHRGTHDMGVRNTHRIEHRGDIVGHRKQRVRGRHVMALLHGTECSEDINVGNSNCRNRQARVTVVEADDPKPLVSKECTLFIRIFDRSDLFTQTRDKDERTSVDLACFFV